MMTPSRPGEIPVPTAPEALNMDPAHRRGHHSDRVLATLRKSPELAWSLFGSDQDQGAEARTGA